METGSSQRESQGCCRQGRGEQKAAEGEVSGSEGAGRQASRQPLVQFRLSARVAPGVNEVSEI